MKTLIAAGSLVLSVAAVYATTLKQLRAAERRRAGSCHELAYGTHTFCVISALARMNSERGFKRLHNLDRCYFGRRCRFGSAP